MSYLFWILGLVYVPGVDGSNPSQANNHKGITLEKIIA